MSALRCRSGPERQPINLTWPEAVRLLREWPPIYGSNRPTRCDIRCCIRNVVVNKVLIDKIFPGRWAKGRLTQLRYGFGFGSRGAQPIAWPT